MLYKAVCSDIRTKHSTQSERHVEFLNVKTRWNVKKPLGFKRLNPIRHLLALVGARHIVHVSRIRVKQHDNIWYFVEDVQCIFRKDFSFYIKDYFMLWNFSVMLHRWFTSNTRYFVVYFRNKLFLRSLPSLL